MRGLEPLLKKSLQKNERGTYVLILSLPIRHKIKIGRLGEFEFKKGTYFYVGSAKAGFSKRVMRYFREKRSKKWHIDYLLEYAKPRGIFFYDNFYSEEEIVKRMERIYLPYLNGFGSSDTHSKTHLFYKEEE